MENNLIYVVKIQCYKTDSLNLNLLQYKKNMQKKFGAPEKSTVVNTLHNFRIF